MTELNTDSGSSVIRRKHLRRKSLHIDFTPMVDLGFLLITFFMLTTSLKDVFILDIDQPIEGPATPVQDSIVMTVLLSGQNKVFYYIGFPETGILQTSFSPNGLRRILLEKNAPQIRKISELRRLLDSKHISRKEFDIKAGQVLADKKSLMVLIKSDEQSRYKNLVDLLDELYITNVRRYSIQAITEEEREFLENQNDF